ncbi:hypothetical protein [Blastococcus deserti]|uniref:LPXTG-motif cell wall-anchored protein n=1 Tax=Blastococcus deserti TaxID=2259033 RepID=A0ABW4XGC2_9ACTN
MDASGAYNGHYGQHADNGDGDVIPPFTYEGQTYSLNWDADGQALHAAGCKADHGNPGNPGGGNPDHGKPGNPGGGNPDHGKPGNPGGGSPGGGNPDGGDDKVTLCHATGSRTNPYVQITVAAAGAYNGHYSQHADNGLGDIIPPFTFQGRTYSLNWDADGQATFAAGCVTTTPQNPGPQNPGPQNPGPQNPAPQNPAPQNPAPQNPGVQNPGVQNPASQVGTAAAAAPKAPAVAGEQASTGPIPVAADAGRQLPGDNWQLLVGGALALAGALGAGTAWFRRAARSR